MKLTTATILAAALLAAPACKKKSNTKVVTAGDATDRSGQLGRAERDDGSATRVSADDGQSAPTFTAIYFEFDSTTLGDEARRQLQDLASWLASHPKARVTIEGHADERGTDEYNIALGEKRARAIQEYLGRLGVERARLPTISYGEERPAARGQGEDSWALNRRGELVPDR